MIPGDILGYAGYREAVCGVLPLSRAPHPAAGAIETNTFRRHSSQCLVSLSGIKDLT
jgi:hypothetical protein